MVVNRPDHTTRTTPKESELFAGGKIVPHDENKIAFRNIWKGPLEPRISNTLAISPEVILTDRIKLKVLRTERRNVHCALFLTIGSDESIGRVRSVEG